jgi:hypothetical protein
MIDKPTPAPESLPDSPKPQFLEGGCPLREEDACCVLRHHLSEEFDISAFRSPDDKTNP